MDAKAKIFLLIDILVLPFTPNLCLAWDFSISCPRCCSNFSLHNLLCLLSISFNNLLYEGCHVTSLLLKSFGSLFLTKLSLKVLLWHWKQKCKLLSRVRLFLTPWTVAHQGPLSMGILQGTILEGVTGSSSRASSQSRDQTRVSHIAGRFFTIWGTREGHSQFCFSLPLIMGFLSLSSFLTLSFPLIH